MGLLPIGRGREEFHVGMDVVQHIVVGNVMTSGCFICIHMYLRRRHGALWLPYVRVRVIMVSIAIIWYKVPRSVIVGIIIIAWVELHILW